MAKTIKLLEAAEATERFVEIYSELTGITEQSPNATTTAYAGSLSGIGRVVITSDAVQCLLISGKVDQNLLKAVLSNEA